MSEISTEELKTNIVEILKTADLSVLTSKTVREKLEKKLGCSLVSRKKQIDAIVMDEINKKNNSASESGSEEEESESPVKNDSPSEDEKPTKRAAAPTRRAPAKKKRKSINNSDDGDSDDGSDEDYTESNHRSTKKPAKEKRKAGSGPKKGTGFTRPYNLSPELSALMGSDSLPRHAVVKKIWSIIKERNLYDPKNKQYAICDEELFPIMKIKRFRTFGMLKYLKPHFIN